jgi:hypothetical protein
MTDEIAIANIILTMEKLKPFPLKPEKDRLYTIIPLFDVVLEVIARAM